MSIAIPLYRFLDADGALKTLVAGTFRVGQLSKFNDPFEWQFGFTGITTPEEQQAADTIRMEHRAWAESWMGILCFSTSVAEPVLWSLYSDKHRGVAFEVKYPWEHDNIHEMKYLKERPVLDFAQLRKHHNVVERDTYLKSQLGCLIYTRIERF
ncbi:MAG: hypothetical protein NT154_09025, partial [Verrucomicrobia bacterium]|nr:hypothetical protein [Verrucomicrobiota bacterium]